MPVVVVKKTNQTEWRPYLLRAMHEWMSDNGHTPHIVVNADVDGLVGVVGECVACGGHNQQAT